MWLIIKIPKEEEEILRTRYSRAGIKYLIETALKMYANEIKAKNNNKGGK